MATLQALRKQQRELFYQSLGPNGQSAVHAYWQDSHKPGNLDPIEIFKHALDAKVRQGEIPQAQATILTEHLAKSFAPESVTGYWDKHRQILFEGILADYRAQTPDTPIYRIEADFMNLGGLNKACDGNKAIANPVLRILSQILREEIARLGDSYAIRTGGDELSLYLRPNEDVSDEGVQQAIAKAQARMKEFVLEAGLASIAHTKKDKPPGVGLGIGYVCMNKCASEVAMIAALEKAISENKRQFSESIQSENAKPFNRDALEGATRTRQYAALLANPDGKKQASAPDISYAGKSPSDAMLERLKRKLAANGELEAAVVPPVFNLARHIDHVTGLPMFNEMASSMLPHFKTRFGTRKAKVVHIDFNNIGGGNDLGYWVGNAMAAKFKECVDAAFAHSSLNEYRDYLCSQGGGKFALLVPHHVQEGIIRNFARAVDDALKEREEEPLNLSKEEFKYSNGRVREKAKKAIKRRGAATADDAELLERKIPVNPEFLCIADISHMRNRRAGTKAQVQAATCLFFEEIPPNDADRNLLNKTVQRLERFASHGQEEKFELETARQAQRLGREYVLPKNPHYSDIEHGYAQSTHENRGMRLDALPVSKIGTADPRKTRENPKTRIDAKGTIRLGEVTASEEKQR
jgi:GGDEF domain-containing protein